MTLPRTLALLSAGILCSAFVLCSSRLVASWTMPRLHACAAGEPLLTDNGMPQCDCDGYITAAGAMGQLICTGRCTPGSSMQPNAAGEPVCMRDLTVEERLQRIEEKLDQHTKETDPRKTLLLRSSDFFQALHARDCLRVTEFDAIEKVESCGCQVPK